MILELEINGTRVRISGENLSFAVFEEKSEPVKIDFVPDPFPRPGHILTLADLYCGKVGIAASTLSTAMFNDGKRIGRLRSGLGITVQSYNDAMRWFQNHWEEDWFWPHHVPRPSSEVAA